MNIRAHRKRPASVLPGLFMVLALLLGQPACDRKPNSSPGQAAASAAPDQSKIKLIPVTNMVAITAGTFMRIKFPVTITRDFWIGKFEVTQDESLAVLG